MTRSFSGFLLVAISAAAFGAMPIFARAAYASGTDPNTILFLRFSSAGLIMLGVMRLTGRRFPRGKYLLGAAAMGGLGYVGQSLSYFNALLFAPAGMVALLLYLYPAIVTALSTLLFREHLSPLKLAALLLALGGAALIIGPEGGGQPLGIALGLAAALIYSFYILGGSRLMKQIDSVTVSSVVMLSAALMFGVIIAGWGWRLPQTSAGWWAIAAISIVSTVIAVGAFLAGIDRIGAGTASTTSTLEPVVTVTLAAFLLGEPITPLKIAGGALILTAVLLLSRVKSRTAG
jgi:drug/metabolite transporter (DMT)-like permease